MGPACLQQHIHDDQLSEGATESMLIGLYHGSNFVPASSCALQQLVREARALPCTSPAGCTAQQLVACASHRSRIQGSVCYVALAIMRAAQAVSIALQADQTSRSYRSTPPQQQGMLVLQQLAQPQLAQALADACTCLAPPQLPAASRTAGRISSEDCAPAIAAGAAGPWATLLRHEVLQAAAIETMANMTKCGQAAQQLQQQLQQPVPTSEALDLDTVDQQVTYGADVVANCAAAARELVNSAGAAAQLQAAVAAGPLGGPCASEAILEALQQSRLLAVVCGALLRIDPARPPSGHGAHTLFQHLTAATNHVVTAVKLYLEMTDNDCCDDADRQAVLGSALARSRTAEFVRQLVTQPHVLKLLYAVMEAFLQEPPPSVASMLAAPGAAAGGSNATDATGQSATSNGSSGAGGASGTSGPTALAGARHSRDVAISGANRISGSLADSAAAAFLPSASIDDELSNMVLQRTWPLLAVCPLVRYLYLGKLQLDAALPSVPRSSSQAAAAAAAAASANVISSRYNTLDQLWTIGTHLWFLPFRVMVFERIMGEGHPMLPAVPAIKAHLPGLPGFCRISVRFSRWCSHAAEATAAACLLPGGALGVADHLLLRHVSQMIALPPSIACAAMMWGKVRSHQLLQRAHYLGWFTDWERRAKLAMRGCLSAVVVQMYQCCCRSRSE